jgi:hypothetical protein
MLKTLKIAGVESLPLFKCVQSIMKDDRIEVYIKPVQKRYK